jgi:antirestriction protein
MADLSDERAFYYVDGIPTKGLWIDLDSITDTDDVIEALHEAELCAEDYDGDLLVADVDGTVAHHFLSRYGSFDLSDWQEVRDEAPRHVTAEAISAYLDYAGTWSKNDFEEAYWGEADSEKKFAEQYGEEYMDIPEHLEGYIDYEALARDLFVNDFYFNDGYVFRRN